MTICRFSLRILCYCIIFLIMTANKCMNMLMTLVIGLFLSSFLSSSSFDRFDVSNKSMYSMYECVRVYMSEITLSLRNQWQHFCCPVSCKDYVKCAEEATYIYLIRWPVSFIAHVAGFLTQAADSIHQYFLW